jgi:hypothetical protein
MLRGAMFCILVVSAAPAFLEAQNQDPPATAEQPADQYFSGTVVSFSLEKVTVSRTILGKSDSSRSFSITSETQIDGKLRAKVRVTVQYVTKDDLDRAIRIVVRNNDPKKQR